MDSALSGGDNRALVNRREALTFDRRDGELLGVRLEECFSAPGLISREPGDWLREEEEVVVRRLLLLLSPDVVLDGTFRRRLFRAFKLLERLLLLLRDLLRVRLLPRVLRPLLGFRLLELEATVSSPSSKSGDTERALLPTLLVGVARPVRRREDDDF